MSLLTDHNPIGRDELQTPSGVFYAFIVGIIGVVGVLAPSEKLSAQNAPEKKLREHEIRIVIPENPTPEANSSGTVQIRLPEKTKGLVGNWGQTIQGVPLPSVNEKRQPLSGPLAGSIEPRDVNETTGSYRITTSKEQILESKPGEIAVSVRNGQYLLPGAYRGEIPFSLKLTPDDVNQTEIVAPDPEPHRLTILILKLGRRLHELRISTDRGMNQSIAFGKPWRLDLDVDEFHESGQSLSAPLALDWHVRLRYRQAVAEPPAVPAVATEIHLADFAMNANGIEEVCFVPPAEADSNLSPLWKELFFDPSAFTGEQQRAPENPTELRSTLYNSRTQPGGRGPTSWYDPVIWKAATNKPQVMTEYPASQKERDGVGVAWTRKTLSLGFPALDVLGQVTAQVHFAESTAAAGNQIVNQADVAPGFAIFPSIAIVNEPLLFVAATRDVSLKNAAPKFSMTNLLKGASAKGAGEPFEMVQEEQPRGEGIRFDRIRFSNGIGPSLFPLRSEGQWEINLVKDSVVIDSAAKQEWILPENVRVTAQCPFPQEMVLFAGKCPFVFDVPMKWFSGAVKREEGCQISESGWIVTTHSPLTWSVVPGVTSQLDVWPLTPIQKASSDRFTTAHEPDCIVHAPDNRVDIDRKDGKVYVTGSDGKAYVDESDGRKVEVNRSMLFVPQKWQPVTATGPAYTITMTYPEQFAAERNNRPTGVKHLSLPASTDKRNFEYKLPFLMRARTDQGGAFFRVVTRPIPFRVRIDADYSDLMWIWSGIGAVFSMIIIGIVVASIRALRSEVAVAEERPPPPRIPTDVLDGSERPVEKPSVTPAPSVATPPEPPVDDRTSIL